MNETFTDNDQSSFDNNHHIFVDSFVNNYDLDSNSNLDKVTISELESVIKKLKTVICRGEDKIHNILLKNLLNSFVILLLKLINDSIVSGIQQSSSFINYQMKICVSIYAIAVKTCD